MDSFNYKTKQGERWDIVAVNMFGNISGISILSDANPDVPMDPVFPDGTILVIPILDPTSTDVATSKLPPWKS